MKKLFFSCLFIFSFYQAYANPFFSDDGTKNAAPPPVYSTGQNAFIKLQFEYRDKISEIIYNAKNNGSNIFFIYLIAFSFLYGIFHAAGPGHRKTILFSIFLSRRSTPLEPAAAGFLSSGIHAGTSLGVIAILYVIQKTLISLSSADNIYAWMEGATFSLIFLFSIFLLTHKFIQFRKKTAYIAAERDSKSLYLMIILTSMVPCPGAMMLMLLSLYAEMPEAGITGIIAMSFGMGIIISISAYLAYAGRKAVFLKFKKHEKNIQFFSSVLEIFSFLLIMLFSAAMAYPFLRSLYFY
ncbi:MAG: hypothetical protein KBH06_09500 [Spirochaetes bacterium]|nr:hypothetical protein [Spirochaetota bacterium]